LEFLFHGKVLLRTSSVDDASLKDDFLSSSKIFQQNKSPTLCAMPIHRPGFSFVDGNISSVSRYTIGSQN
jgi:hypothetical protein